MSIPKVHYTGSMAGRFIPAAHRRLPLYLLTNTDHDTPGQSYEQSHRTDENGDQKASSAHHFKTQTFQYIMQHGKHDKTSQRYHHQYHESFDLPPVMDEGVNHRCNAGIAQQDPRQVIVYTNDQGQ